MAFDETISMRPGEELPVERLAAYLRGRLPGSENALRVRQFGGGAANLTYLLDYGTHQYVLRRPPHGPLPPSAHDMHREYRVLSVLWQAFPLAPRAFLFCEDPSVIGAPFFVMERRVGVVVRREMPPQFAAVPNAARLMSAALVDALADFHAVEYAALGLSDLGTPQGFIHRQIEGWYRRWQAARTDDLPLMDELHAWLLAHEPPENAPALVHNERSTAYAGDGCLDYAHRLRFHASPRTGGAVCPTQWPRCTTHWVLPHAGVVSHRGHSGADLQALSCRANAR